MYFSSVGEYTELLLKSRSWILTAKTCSPERVSISFPLESWLNSGPIISQLNWILVRTFEYFPLVSEDALGAYLSQIKFSKHWRWVLNYRVGRGWLTSDNLTPPEDWRRNVYSDLGTEKGVIRWACYREGLSRWRTKSRGEGHFGWGFQTAIAKHSKLQI